MEQSGSHGARGDAERLGDLLERKSEIVMEDDHRAVVHGELPERPFKLVPVGDRREGVGRFHVIEAEDSEVGRPAPGLPGLGIAGTDEGAVRPPLESSRFAKLRELAPDAHQGLLRGVVGEVGVAKDPVRHGVQSVAHDDGEAREGPFVTVLRLHDQVRGIHASPAVRRPVSPGVQKIRGGSGGQRLKFHRAVAGGSMSCQSAGTSSLTRSGSAPASTSARRAPDGITASSAARWR